MTISAPAGPRSAPTRTLIDRAAARLRHETAQAQYGGLRDPQVAFGFAAMLDELSSHLRDVDGPLRRRIVQLCGEVLGAP